MRILILANGEPPSASLAQKLAARHDLLMATDGAAHRAVGLGLTPAIICGDFDSANVDIARGEFPEAEFLPTPDQERGDLEKAVLLALDRGATAITILGAGGGRMDHTLANFALLLRYTERPICIADEYGTTYSVAGTEARPGALTLSVSPGDTLSLISFDGAASVTLTGTKWLLQDERLPVGTHGIGNLAEAERVEVRVRGGALFVCHLNQTQSL
jgi:thiamine pyrophosphokinase